MADIEKLVGDESPLELGQKINEIIERGGGGGLEIGDIGIAPLGLDESQNKRRYINGQLILQDQFVSFTNKVKKAVELYPSLACTEEQWQATVTMSAFGQCGKFVIDDEAGTIRLPKITGFIQGLTDLASLGELVEAGLPTISHTHTRGTMDITGRAGVGQGGMSSANSTGAFYVATSNGSHMYGNGANSTTNETQIHFQASRNWTGATSTNSAVPAVYGKSTTVQPESIRYPYFIQVATGVEESVDVTREIELNNPFSLLDYKFSEYELNNLSWLRSNGQWNSNAVYPAVYELLLKIYNGTETKAGVNVKLHTEEYTDYNFVLNTADETFRLPIKVKLASGKAVVGNGMVVGLTNGTQNAGLTTTGSAGILGGSLSTYGQSLGYGQNGSYLTTIKGVGVTTDPTKSGLELSDSDLYLYFYVGETVQNANLINAGRIEENVASIKADVQNVNNKVNTILSGSQNPDYSRAISIGQYYTCPSDGYIILKTVVVASGGEVIAYINNVSISHFHNVDNVNVRWGGGMFKVSKGDFVAHTWSEALFIPEKGV